MVECSGDLLLLLEQKCFLESMARKEKLASSGYGRPPWVFKGSALYQLHLVKADTARALIPKGLRLVEAFGYTLGGFFLASYDDSPAGVFDELVVIAGIVWNPPTSCAWAARVLVSSYDACMHGRKDVGLPSQVARFSKVGFQTIRAIPRTREAKLGGLLHLAGVFSPDVQKTCADVHVSEINGQQAMSICNINFNPIVPETQSRKWKGPLINMSLPSFSGLTKYNPHLLKYSCQIECRVRAIQPAKVSGPHKISDEESCCQTENCSCDSDTKERRLSMRVMLSKPILALEFSCLKMKVEAPKMISEHLQISQR